MEKELKKHVEDVEAFNSTDPKDLAAFAEKYLGSKGVLKDLFMMYKEAPATQKLKYAEAMGAFRILVTRKMKSLEN